MPVGDLYRASVFWDQNGRNAANVFHFLQQDADGSEDPAAVLAAGIDQKISAGLTGLLSNQIRVSSIEIKRLLPTPTQTRSFGASSVGAVAQEILPPQTNMTVSLYSNLFSKRGRGRARVVGLPITTVTNSNFNFGTIGAILAWWSTFVTAWQAAGSAINFVYQIYSIADNASRAVQKIIAEPNARKQRSRRS